MDMFIFGSFIFGINRSSLYYHFLILLGPLLDGLGGGSTSRDLCFTKLIHNSLKSKTALPACLGYHMD